MKTSEIMGRMGSMATEQDAIAMIYVLESNGYDLETMDTATIPENEWLAMIDEAIAR
jgi:hypothetical protein